MRYRTPAWLIQLPNGTLVFGRHGDRVDTVDEQFARYAHRYTRKLAQKVAAEIGGTVVKLNIDGSVSTEK